METIYKEMVIAFLKEYAELIRKHKVYVSACGCCNSPYLWAIENNESIEKEVNDEIENLLYNEDISMEEYKKTIGEE